MLHLQQKPPTFILREIADRIDAKTTELFLSFTKTQPIKQTLSQITTPTKNQETRICNRTITTEKSPFKAEQAFIETVKNQLCRIISAELPIVVNYETKINDKIQDLEEELAECKKQLKGEKVNYKDFILEKDNLKVDLLSKQHQIQQLTDQAESYKEKQNEAMLLVNTYMKEIHSLQEKVQELEAQNAKLKQNEQKDEQMENNFGPGPSPKELTADMTLPKSSSKQFNYPLQMRQKLNQAEIVLNRSPRSNDPHLESSHFQLSSEIIGCQKQLLQIELKSTERDKAQLALELQEERNYTKSLLKEMDDLQKLVDGEKRLNEKLDRELYTLINATKEMKIQLLEERTKSKQLEEEVLEMEEEIGNHHKETTLLQERITELEISQRRIPKLEDEANELKAKLQISNKKYEELRRIKHELEQKIEQFEAKIVQIQKKQSEDQLKQISFQQTIKFQNSSKIKQIEEMSLMIKAKYEKKIEVLERHYKEVKEKCKYYKQENSKLYESFEVQTKKQAKLSDQYQKTKTQNQKMEHQFIASKHTLELAEEKLKTQTLLAKELKRELLNSERAKSQLQRKIKKTLAKLPNILSEVRSLKQETFTVKSIFQTYNEILNKTGPKQVLEFESSLNRIFTEKYQKHDTLQNDLNKKITLLEHWKKQTENSENDKLKLIQRLNGLQSKEALFVQQIEAKQNQMSLLNQRLALIQSINAKLERQIQNYRKIQKSGLEQIEILKEKQKEIEGFYSLVDDLTEQNRALKKRLDEQISNHEEYVTFNKNKKSHKDYFHHHNHHSHNSHRNNEDVPSYLIPQKQSKQKSSSRSKEGVATSHSCVHLQLLSKNKSLLGMADPTRNLSYEKQLQNKSQYDQTLPNQLPIHSRPAVCDSRNSQKYHEPCSVFPSSQTMEFREQKSLMKYNFESQKQRLQEIKLEYQKMMAEKFREEFIEKMTQERTGY